MSSFVITVVANQDCCRRPRYRWCRGAKLVQCEGVRFSFWCVCLRAHSVRLVLAALARKPRINTRQWLNPIPPIAWWRFEGGLSDSSGAGRSAQLGPARGLRERRTGNIHGNAQVHRFRAPRGRGVPPRLCRFAVRNGCEVR